MNLKPLRLVLEYVLGRVQIENPHFVRRGTRHGQCAQLLVSKESFLDWHFEVSESHVDTDTPEMLDY
jgi:hypothetical protein